MTLLAALPVLVCVGLLAARRPALQAALCGVGAAVGVAAWRFAVPALSWPTLAASWLPVLLEVLVIVAGGLALSEANRRTGRQAELADWLRVALGGGAGASLAVVHGVTPFAESVTGFGIGVTVAVPLLLHLGFDSGRAVLIGLLGLCAVPWGSMGPGTLIAAELSGLPLADLGLASAFASGPVFLGVGLVAAWLSSAPGARVRALTGALASGALLWVCVIGVNAVVGTAPAGAVGALLTLAGHLVFHRMRGARPAPLHRLRDPLAGYLVLLGGVLAGTAALMLTGAADTGWRYLASPALWLVLAVATTTPRSVLRPVLAAAARSWLRAGPVTGLFVVLGVVMASSGMARALAQGIAAIGPGYAVLLPFVAALGGYLTGSNSAANAMFAAPQSQIVTTLGLPHLASMGVHNVASSLTLMASPAKVELAAQLSDDPSVGRRAGARVLAVDAAITCCLAVVMTVLLALS